MSVCPKCGAKVTEDMSFCPKCGAPLKVPQSLGETKPSTMPKRSEKEEKHEKREKKEKTEKYEKREVGFIGWFIGGFVLIILGLVSFLRMTHFFRQEEAWAIFLLVVGAIIIVAALYATMTATRRHPKT